MFRLSREVLATVFIGFVVLNAVIGSSNAKHDPASYRIRTYCIGESYYPETSFPLLIQGDPRIFYVPIPANLAETTFYIASGGGGEEAARKFMRLYLPRTYNQLVSSVDLVMISDFEAWLIPNQQYEWMRKAMEEEGMGLAKYEINWDIGGFYIKSNEFIDLWIASPLFEAFPVDFVMGEQIEHSMGIIPVENNPVTDLPGIENYNLLGSGDYGIETPREGASILAVFRNDPDRNPAMISWEYGKATSLSVVPGLDKIDSAAMNQYQYYVDFWINQLYWAASFPIPEDVDIVNVIRRQMVHYATHRPLIISVIDFVEKFGASLSELNRDLGEVDGAKAEADRLYYVEQSYTESLDRLTEAIDMLNDISTKALVLKERALLWVYIIEWFTVTGTLFLTSYILYSLMIKRRLYREVHITRLREAEGS